MFILHWVPHILYWFLLSCREARPCSSLALSFNTILVADDTMTHHVLNIYLCDSVLGHQPFFPSVAITRKLRISCWVVGFRHSWLSHTTNKFELLQRQRINITRGFTAFSESTPPAFTCFSDFLGRRKFWGEAVRPCSYVTKRTVVGVIFI